MTMPQEKSIQFGAHMVRSILDGSKTVTRQFIQQRTLSIIKYGVDLGECLGLPDWGPVHPNDEQYLADFCPFGKTGDRLWVKEATEADYKDMNDPKMARYVADKSPVLNPDGTVAPWDYSKYTRPSIRMQRWKSRILLEITSVRIERLQDITDEQCIAEGIIPVPKIRPDFPEERQFWRDYHLSGDGTFCCNSPRESFQTLWRHNRGKTFEKAPDTWEDGWDANPWVWVVSFRRVEPGQALTAQAGAA
ncbi:hypothetical protein V0M98_34645 (plasmid) [Pseudomonas silesiensis]|uniref:hypothetical protein n=1 Tax=Pseudomonas silesiensis TaxID=1853130 RepID=UPI0030CFF89A